MLFAQFLIQYDQIAQTATHGQSLAVNKGGLMRECCQTCYRVSRLNMEPKSTSDIHTLPPEVWSIITVLLEAHTVRTLWVASDNRLRSALERGGITSLTVHTQGAWSDEVSWPSGLLSRFPAIRVLNVSRTRGHWYGPPRAVRILKVSQLAMIPSTVRTLDLSNYFVDIGGYGDSATISRLFKALPKALTSLSMPEYVVTPSCIDYLPPSLTRLELKSSRLGSEGLKKLPADLQHLILESDPMSSDDLIHLPRELLTFSLYYYKTSRNTTPFQPQALFSLPPNLTSLSLNAAISLKVSALNNLPSSLEILRLPRTSIVEDLHNSPLSVPSGITSLYLESIQGRLIRDAFRHLPPGILSFGLRKSTNLLPSLVIQLPRNLTSLFLFKATRLTSTSLRALPPSLTRLEISGLTISDQFIIDLPPKLKYLNTHSSALSISDMSPLSSHLLDLREWKTERAYSITLPSLFSLVKFQDKPTLFRTLAWKLVTLTPSKVAELLFGAATFYFLYQRRNILLPAVPNIISSLLLRSHNSLVGIGIGFLYAFV